MPAPFLSRARGEFFDFRLFQAEHDEACLYTEHASEANHFLPKAYNLGSSGFFQLKSSFFSNVKTELKNKNKK